MSIKDQPPKRKTLLGKILDKILRRQLEKTKLVKAPKKDPDNVKRET